MKRSLLGLLLALAMVLGGCSPGATPGEQPGGEKPGGSEEEIVWTVPDTAYDSYCNRVLYVNDVGLVTGQSARVDATQWGAAAVDIGVCFYDEARGRLYAAFGDTFSKPIQDGHLSGDWNSNSVLYTDNLDLSTGIEWKGALPGQNGKKLQVTPLSYGKIDTTIPTGAVVIDGVYYLFYMEITENGFSSDGSWDVYSNRVIKSADGGQTWTLVESLEWVSNYQDGREGEAPNFGQIYPYLDSDGYVYIYGIPGGRSGGVKLGRVKKENFEDFDAYEYLRRVDDSGDPIWSDKGAAGLAQIKNAPKSFIVDPSCGEICISYNKYLQRYTMTYLQSNTAIVMRRSPKPWGGWSDADVLVRNSDIPSLYGAFTHPVMTTHDGKRMYMLVSQWSSDLYNVHVLEVVFR